MPINGLIERQLYISWLLASVLLMAVFSGELCENMIKDKPRVKIDRFDDLLTKPEWSESKIYCLMGFHVFDRLYINLRGEDGDNLESKYSALQPKMEFIDPISLFYNHNETRQIMDNIIVNNDVYSDVFFFVLYLLNTTRSESKFMDRPKYEEGIDYYVSKPEYSEAFYFLINNIEFNQTLLNQLNRV